MLARRAFCTAFAVTCAGLATRIVNAAQQLTLATSEWPPYTGSALPDQGLVSSLIRLALAAKGYTATIEVVPWERAKQGALGGDYGGYFAAYEAAAGGVASRSILQTPLMIAQRKSAPLSFTNAGDLRGKTIGVVEGYSNEPEFDKLAAAGAISTDPASDDAGSLRKLVAGRIDGAIIDQYVFTYIMHNDDGLKASIDTVELNPTPLANKAVHLVVKDTAAGRTLLNDFDQAIAAIDIKSAIAAYMEKAGL